MKKLIILSATFLVGLAFASTASAATWTNVAGASDRSPYFTFAYLSKSNVNATYPLRASVRAPRGWTRASGSVFCWDEETYEFGSRNFAWRYFSRGRTHHFRRSVPTLGFSRCDVSLDADGKGGWLTLRLQRYS